MLNITRATKSELIAYIAKLEEELALARTMAMEDALTGVASRRAFDDNLTVTLSRASRYHERYCILIGDVNNFKPFNDRYGHNYGDEVLKAIARCLKAAVVRPGDMVARYGGDEFAFILRVEEDVYDVFIARLEEAFAQLRAEKERELGSGHPELELWNNLSISFGHEIISQGEDAADLIQRIDTQMYENKRKSKKVA